MSYMKIISILVFLGMTCALSMYAVRSYQHEKEQQLFEQYQNMARDMSVNFDISMRAADFPHVYDQEHNKQILQCLKYIYNKYNFSQVPVQQECKIPKIIHCVWLGSKLPEKYVPYYQTWKDMHPHWTFIFWTDTPENYDQGVRVRSFDELSEALTKGDQKFLVVDTRDINFDNKKFFDEAINYGERSDILKWEIVYRFGGMYVDTDFECLRPFDFLHHMYDFYTGIQPLDTACLQLGAALFAAVPGHPILKYCVDTIKDDHKHHEIVLKTGPLHFTKSFYFAATKDNTAAVALPASYFYPCSYGQAGQPESVWRKPESMAVHHWAGSWLHEGGFKDKEVYRRIQKRREAQA